MNATTTARRLMIGVAMERHGYWKAWFWYTTLTDSKLQGLYVAEKQDVEMVPLGEDTATGTQQRSAHSLANPLVS